MDGQTRLTVVPDEGAAEVVCGLLRSEGILCFHRPTDLGAEAAIAAVGQWKEIVVRVDDLPRAQELLHGVEAALDDCVRCGRPIGDEGGWYRDDAGELQPYCAVCADRVFG